MSLNKNCKNFYFIIGGENENAYWKSTSEIKFYFLIICALILLIYCIIFIRNIIKSSGFRKFKFKEEKKSIFSFLDLIIEDIKNEQNESLKNPLEKKKKFVFLFDCYETFCSCCCQYWLQKIYFPFRYFCLKIVYKISLRFNMNLKTYGIVFITFGNFFLIPTLNLLSIIDSKCVTNEIKQYSEILGIIVKIMFLIITISLSTIFFFNCLFIISFVSIRKEMFKVQNNKQRGMLIFYCLKKATIFSFFVICVEIIFINIKFNDANIDYENTTMPVFYLFKNFF